MTKPINIKREFKPSLSRVTIEVTGRQCFERAMGDIDSFQRVAGHPFTAVWNCFSHPDITFTDLMTHHFYAEHYEEARDMVWAILHDLCDTDKD